MSWRMDNLLERLDGALDRIRALEDDVKELKVNLNFYPSGYTDDCVPIKKVVIAILDELDLRVLSEHEKEVLAPKEDDS